MTTLTTARRKKAAKLPPRWFMRWFWFTHRRVVGWTRGRLGLWRPRPGRWGAMYVTTVGRRTGTPHAVLVGYLEDGPDLVTMAMNGWQPGEPSWWRNVQAHPDVTVQTRDGVRAVTAHAATGAERERLWARWEEVDGDLESFAARRPEQTAVVVFSPRTAR